MHNVNRAGLPLLLGVAALAFAADAPHAALGSTFEGHPAATLGNGKIEIAVLKQGSTIASIVLRDDAGKLSPLWNPIRMSREQGRTANFNPGLGHFVCVDGFGPVSPEERAAGMPGHGEAHLQDFEIRPAVDDGTAVLTMSAKLPLVQENFTRTFRMREGENVVYVESQLENFLSFDRPVNWAEHATIGSPWLESGVTVVDVSGSKSQTRPWPAAEGAGNQMQRRLPSGKDFTWPLAPGINGETIDMRQAPQNPHYRDHATTLLDPSREFAWVTAINPARRQILGYLFRRSDYPWLQTWGDYPPSGKMARGMEFGTQPYDVSHRDAVTMGSLFGVPAFRWLPAKSKIQTRFLMFFAPVPEGFTKVDDVRLETGQIGIQGGGKQIALAASLGL
jgi:hypothetical protein